MADTKLARITERLSQLRQAFATTRQQDPRLVPLLVAIPGALIVVGAVVGASVGMTAAGAGVGVLLGLLAGIALFTRRMQKAAIASIEGQPGAAAAVLESMRGPWEVTPAVAASRKQGFVHRVIGRPGVVLVGEGSPNRVNGLLKQERRRVARAVGDVPIHEVIVGDQEDHVPLRKLQSHLMRLPRAIKPRQVGPLNTKLSALGGQEMPIPKGPMPGGADPRSASSRRVRRAKGG